MSLRYQPTYANRRSTLARSLARPSQNWWDHTVVAIGMNVVPDQCESKGGEGNV